MKIVLGYPPLQSSKGIPLLAQNRQFQWAHSSWTAYPMVPASAATLLKEHGYEVYWLDGINAGQTYEQWRHELQKLKPDILVMETKTPVIKKHWQIINKLKIENLPRRQAGLKLKIVLVGDHVTALPEESFKNSRVDYILTGGDYDFLLLNLLNHLNRGEKLEAGIWYKKNSKFKIQNLKFKNQKVLNAGKFRLNHNLNKLPFIDRDLTRWRLYAYKNSNYLRLPGTYTMFGRDCWWGRCSFCAWTTLYPGKCYRAIKPQKALEEIGRLIGKYQVKEIMDDSGTFPVGEWLQEFCQGMIERGYAQKIRISCNLRLNAGLSQKDYQLMGRAGFRFILYGLESANQKTLDRLNKNLKINQVEPALSWAKMAGLNPHLTVMVGYPWETKKDVLKTLVFAKSLFKKGLIDSLQATLVIPYPGTSLFKEAKKNGWLKTEDWNKYDMRRSVLKTTLSDEELKKVIQDFYKSVFSLSFLLRKTKEALTNFDVFKYYVRLGLKLPSKLLDFSVKGQTLHASKV